MAITLPKLLCKRLKAVVQKYGFVPSEVLTVLARDNVKIFKQRFYKSLQKDIKIQMQKEYYVCCMTIKYLQNLLRADNLQLD